MHHHDADTPLPDALPAHLADTLAATLPDTLPADLNEPAWLYGGPIPATFAEYLAAEGLRIEHCAHCDRHDDTDPFAHPSCYVARLDDPTVPPRPVQIPYIRRFSIDLRNTDAEALVRPKRVAQ